jgi:uracil-DNA glycosylase
VGQTSLFGEDSRADPANDNRLRETLAGPFARVPQPWRGVTEPFLVGAVGQALVTFVDSRVQGGAVVYPKNVFRALEFAPPEAVRVVILGQDPYHGPGQAQGLAFSVAPGQKRLPPSLRNILKEVAADTGSPSECRDDLSAWAAQGVLLLNSALTVEDGGPQSHAGRGWEALTDALLAHIAAQPMPAVFMLWGAAAQKKKALLERGGGGRHLLLEANHPSPLAANRPPAPFLGCRHFSRADAFLATHRPGGVPMRW